MFWAICEHFRHGRCTHRARIPPCIEFSCVHRPTLSHGGIKFMNEEESHACEMAEGNLSQFIDNLDEKVLECAICLKRLRQPKTLACLHAFCLSCLQDWVKRKEGLVCPTCSQSYTIPEGGLQKLPPNTFIINLLESIEQLEKGEKVKCLCGKSYADCYCQDCRNYLCSSCKDQHKVFPQLMDHMIHSIEDVQSMSPIERSSLNPPLCSLHKDKTLEFYCKVCLTPICTNCAITEHNEHKPVDIYDAFNEFVETTVQLQQDVEDVKATLQASRDNIHLNAKRLEENEEKCRNDVDTLVEEMKNVIKEMEEKLLKELHELYAKKKKMSTSQIDELSRTTSDVNTRWNYISQLLRSNKATALQSSHNAVAALQKTMTDLPDLEAKDNGEVHFLQEKESFIKFKQDGIGCFVENIIDYFKIDEGVMVITEGNSFMIKISDKYTSQLNATLTNTSNLKEIASSRAKVEQQSNGGCVITGMCPSTGVWKLDVSLGNQPILGSPLMINVQKEGLEKSIEMKQYVTDVVMNKGGHLLVACQSNEIIKLSQLGILEAKIPLPKGVQVNRIHKMETHGNIIFSDKGNNCLTICQPDGQAIKSICKGVLMDPWGVVVNKDINWIYVVDSLKECIFVFDQRNSQQIKTFGGRGSAPGMMNKPTDITLTKEGNVIVADTYNHRIQMFDSKGSFIQVLIGYGAEDGSVVCPCGVVIDTDENLIVASQHKLQIFSTKGKFIKRIDREGDEIKNPYGLCIISQYPRRIGVANWGNKDVKIFNY